MGSIYDLSTVAASNTTIDSTDVSGTTGKIKDGDNVMRSLGAFDAQFVDDLGAVNTVAGTGDVITVALSSAITAYATGQIFRFIAGAANTTNVTMNVNSIGAKAVRKISGGTDVALVAGDLVAGETYTLIYRASANAAAGAWVLVGTALTSNPGGFATTATAAGTTTLTVSSARMQEFTGSTTQTVVLPVVSTFAAAGAGAYTIINQSTGILTIQSSGANTIMTLMPKAVASFVNNAIAGTGASVWDIVGPSGTGIDLGAVGRIKFPSVANPATDLNTLDYYGEGTFTIGMTFGGSATSVAFSANTGLYVRVGRLVTISILITLTNNGTGTGAAVITGLPFTAVNGVQLATMTMGSWSGMSAVVGTPVGTVAQAGTSISLNMSGGTASVAMTDTNITNTASFTISGCYVTDV